jgi:hypothetical protein
MNKKDAIELARRLHEILLRIREVPFKLGDFKGPDFSVFLKELKEGSRKVVIEIQIDFEEE